MNKKINFFDLGLYASSVTSMFLETLKKLKITNYNIYGFEPRKIYYNYCERLRLLYPKPEKINFFNCAISDKEGLTKLHYSPNGVGDSIFKNKIASLAPDASIPSFLQKYPDLVSNYLYSMGATMVSYETSELEDGSIGLANIHKAKIYKTHKPTEYENVQSLIFSNWLKNNVSDLEDSINILKINIEGAEIHLFKDLADSGLIKHFDVFCGTGDDIEKIPELSHRVEEYKNLLKDNDITIHRFSNWKSERNVNMKQMIEELL